MLLRTVFVVLVPLLLLPRATWADDSPSFTKDVAPILVKHCAGCHNDDDAEGNVSLESFAALQRGGENGALVVAGDSRSSRLIRVLTGKAEPQMPPEDEPRPSEDQIALLARWIDAGAQGPSDDAPDRQSLNTPQIAPSQAAKPITAVAWAPDAGSLAVARFQTVQLRSASSDAMLAELSGHPGKVNAVAFSPDARRLATGSGVTGLYGQTRVWDIPAGRLLQTFGGHQDAVYAIALSPDGQLLATGSYDKVIMLWNLETGKVVHELRGHNGAIYDLDFSPDGRVLASASADTTIKVWSVKSGKRLDTRGEPLKEQYSVAISPNGRFLVGGGADNRIRLWQLVSYNRPRINPLLQARYAHEAPIERLRFTADGQQLASVAADQTLKVWDARRLKLRRSYPQPDTPQALAISAQAIAVGRMDGSLQLYPVESPPPIAVASSGSSILVVPPTDQEDAPIEQVESEPNDLPTEATTVSIPAQIRGRIRAAAGPDEDCFQFVARAGQPWVFEVRADRDGSQLDSHIEVLTAEGRPIPQVLLQAVRDSYFTFRGKDSRQTGDFRLHNWEEMQLDQYLFAAGEVVKLYHYPRGPDSGFNVYPNFGRRHAYFGTSSVTHALHEPCYIVQPHPPGTKLPSSGLPVFTIYYENDDESRQAKGSDSQLTFVAPADGTYVVRVRDVRGADRGDFPYTLLIRRPRPDFTVQVDQNHTVAQGTGKKFGVRLQREDGFDGPVRLDITGMPPGFHVTTPLTVEAGQLRAWGMIWSDERALAPDDKAAAKITATATIGDRQVVKDVGTLGVLKRSNDVQLTVDLRSDAPASEDHPLPVIEVQAGSTATATIRVDRREFKDRIGFGSEEALINAPHGVYVDNIGLNGVLIVEGASERQIFITAEPWVRPMERVVFVEAAVAHRPTSQPVLLRVLPNPGSL